MASVFNDCPALFSAASVVMQIPVALSFIVITAVDISTTEFVRVKSKHGPVPCIRKFH